MQTTTTDSTDAPARKGACVGDDDYCNGRNDTLPCFDCWTYYVCPEGRRNCAAAPGSDATTMCRPCAIRSGAIRGR